MEDSVFLSVHNDSFCYTFQALSAISSPLSYHLSGCKRVDGGVLHLAKRYPTVLSAEHCQHEIETKGKVAPRPYLAGQQWDGECDVCVMALFYHACCALGLDALALYRTHLTSFRIGIRYFNCPN